MSSKSKSKNGSKRNGSTASADAALMAEVERLVHREHHDPHSLLGAHAGDGGMVVRAYRPAAEKVVARDDAGRASS